MDRNSIVGMILIGIILIGYTYLTRPSEEEIKAISQRDSIARLEIENREKQEAERIELLKKQQEPTTMFLGENGAFADTLQHKVQVVILENQHVKLSVNTLGGRISAVELKGYKTHDGEQLMLWGEENAKFGLLFYANNQPVNTQNQFFVLENSVGNVIDASTAEQKLCMRLYAGDDKYIEYIYSLKPDSYRLGFDIKVVGMRDVISLNQRDLTFNWAADIPRQEKNRKIENQYTNIFYKFFEDDVESLNSTGNDAESLSTKVKWIGFKQQFFSSVLIADESFKGIELKTEEKGETSPILKNFSANISLPYEGLQTETYAMNFYFGPNKYKILKDNGEDINLHTLVDLGWKMFAWVNKWFVIPVFNLLEKYIGNYGIIILILTILIKLILSPLTYKSYVSSAKMKVLKPQIDEINKKIPKEKAMERQQATMALYKKAGVNPMGGCLPMLVQFPILIALFRFFPASIELRQQSFLWAKDLSSYDSVLDLPFSIPFYGDHVSLFCLLMAATNMIYTRMNSQMQSSQQMPGMKTMMYIMPVMLLFWFNDYSSGLSYYYFIATLFTILQTWAIRKYMVNDDKILATIEANKKKPVKKSKFQKRLEEAARKKGYKPPRA